MLILDYVLSNSLSFILKICSAFFELKCKFSLEFYGTTRLRVLENSLKRLDVFLHIFDIAVLTILCRKSVANICNVRSTKTSFHFLLALSSIDSFSHHVLLVLFIFRCFPILHKLPYYSLQFNVE